MFTLHFYCFRFVYFALCVWLVCLYVCKCTMHKGGSCGSQKEGTEGSRSRVTDGFESGSSARITDALNY